MPSDVHAAGLEGHAHICRQPDYGVVKKTGVCTEARRHAGALLAKSKTLRDMREFCDSFRKVIAGDSIDDPDTWIDKYSKSPRKQMASFAKGLLPDIKAVKRSMYGRVSDQLLLIKIVMYGRGSPKSMHGN